MSSLVLGMSGPVGAAAERTKALPGSAVRQVARAHFVGEVSADRSLDVVVTLAPRNAELLGSLAASSSASKPLDPEQVQAVFMPSPEDIAAVRAHLARNGLSFRFAKGLSLFFEGGAGAVEKAFGVDLRVYRDAGGRFFRAASGPVRLPAALIEKVAAVDGLDTLARYRPAAEPIAHAVTPVVGCNGPGDFKSASGGYLPADLAGLAGYDYQSLLDGGHDGDGEAIAFVEFSNYRHADVDKFKQCFGLATPVTDVPVNGGTSSLAGSTEVVLDVDIALATAPGLDSAYIYHGPDTTSMAVMINQIVSEHAAKGVQIVSNSWGLCELFITPSELAAENTALQLAAVSGISFFTASGDNGSSDCLPDLSELAVADPAAQPYATAVGGTDLDLSGPRSEATWNDDLGAGGGGLSALWRMPSWQAGVVGPDSSGEPCGATPGYCRQVPDVALSADPDNGYIVYCFTADCGFQGWLKVGGTSAAAPLLAGITADANEYSLANSGERLGFASPFLYNRFGNGGVFFLDVTSGTNDFGGEGKFAAGTGYDLATGLGALDADLLAQELAAFSAAPPDPHGTSVTVSPTTNKTIKYGQGVTFSGVLTDTTSGTPLAGRAVWIQLSDAAGVRVWRAFTDGTGHWSLSLSTAFKRKTSWQAVYLGEEGLLSAESVAHKIYVVPKLTLTTSLTAVSGHYVVRHGTSFTTKGTSKPNMAGATVALQWRPASSSSWHKAASARVSSKGTFAVRGAWTAPGRYYMRWRYSGGTSKPWMTTKSPAKLFVVT